MDPKEKTLKQNIYAAMLEAILRGDYRPGTPFTEKELVEKFAVSKSPIREALIELCHEGVLRSIPRYGYEVLKIDDRDIANVKSYRILVECGSLERYWDNLPLDRIRTMQAELEQGRHAKTDLLGHWNRNSTFHLNLISLYGNQYLYEALASALKLMARAYTQFQWEKWREPAFIGEATNHQQVLSYILAGQKAEALATLEKDIMGFAQR